MMIDSTLCSRRIFLRLVSLFWAGKADGGSSVIELRTRIVASCFVCKLPTMPIDQMGQLMGLFPKADKTDHAAVCPEYYVRPTEG
jgi:hypothetical protein